MRGSIRCSKCNTIMQGGVPQCPNQACEANAAPAADQPVFQGEVRRLPLLEEFVARGYPAERYDEFIAGAKEEAARVGATVEVRAPAGEELEEYQKAVELARVNAAAHQAAQAEVHAAPTAPPPPSSPKQQTTRNLRAVDSKPPKK